MTEPFWKRLFAPGGFEWAFRMRKGDAESFFGRQDPTGALLSARRERLDEHPGRYLAITPAGERLIGSTWDLALGWGQVSIPEDGARDLVGLSRQWEADLLFMDLETRSVAGGAVCFPSSWDLGHAVGKSLTEVHGLVPRLNAQIGEMIDRFLDSLSPGKAFCRENWSFTRSAEADYHPSLNRPRLDETLALDEVFLRVEHQLFTGLPGGVLMGIRIETCPLRDLAADREAWALAAEKLRTMPADVADYKSMSAGIPRMLEEMEAFLPIGG